MAQGVRCEHALKAVDADLAVTSSHCPGVVYGQIKAAPGGAHAITE